MRLLFRSLALVGAICLAEAAYAAGGGNIVTPTGNNGVPIPAIQLGTSQNLSYNAAGGASAPSSAFGASTTLIALSVTLAAGQTGIRVQIAAAPVASATTTLIPVTGMYFFAAAPGGKIAVLSDDANTGSVNITEAVSWQ